MKLSSRIVLNVLLSTGVFSAFAGSAWDRLASTRNTLSANKKEIGIGLGSAAAGALVTYLASNEKVKAYASQTTTAVSNFTKARYQAIVNYWRNLNKSKKIAAGSLAGASVVAAYIYFEGPGVQQVKDKFAKKP